ncbi:hypothetical protein Tco_0651626 [Tanacetum coccineum]|uniref:Uncharacterized protein n=1 Tax=Tanacetum coccineum TaxID=301880 RepID=A0ABQ4WVF3_9ASTR
MEYVKKSIDERALHKREHDRRVNERQTQTTEEKVDSSKALDASLVIIESNGTESQEQDTSSRSGNDCLSQIQKKGFAIAALKNELRYIVQSYKGRTQSLVAEKTDISENKASRNFDLMIKKWCLLKITLQAPFLNVHMTFEQRSSSLVLHQMTSDHNRSELRIQDYSNEQSSSKLVPKVVP